MMDSAWQSWMWTISAPLIVLALQSSLRLAVFALYNWKARDWWDIILHNTYEAIADRAERAQRSQLEQDERELLALSGGTGWIAGDPLTLMPPHLAAIRKRLDAMRLEADIQNHWVRTVASISTAQIVWLWWRKRGKPPGSLSIGTTRRFLDPLRAQAPNGDRNGQINTDTEIEPPAGSATAGGANAAASPVDLPLADAAASPQSSVIDVPIILALIQTLERVAALRAGGYLDQEEYERLKRRSFATFSTQGRSDAP